MRFVRVPPYESWANWTNFLSSWENGDFFGVKTVVPSSTLKMRKRNKKLARVYAYTQQRDSGAPLLRAPLCGANIKQDLSLAMKYLAYTTLLSGKIFVKTFQTTIRHFWSQCSFIDLPFGIMQVAVMKRKTKISKMDLTIQINHCHSWVLANTSNRILDQFTIFENFRSCCINYFD